MATSGGHRVSVCVAPAALVASPAQHTRDTHVRVTFAGNLTYPTTPASATRLLSEAQYCHKLPVILSQGPGLNYTPPGLMGEIADKTGQADRPVLAVRPEGHSVAFGVPAGPGVDGG